MTITVKFPRGARKGRRLDEQLEAVNLTRAAAEGRIRDAAVIADEMLREGLAVLRPIAEGARSRMVDAFAAEPLLETWFGEVTRPRQVRTVHRRLDGICDRFVSGFTAAVRPEDDDSPLAQTAGAANLTGSRFRIYPRGLERDIWDVAELIIHEIGHHWFTDQKLGDLKVYGETRARDLATYDPRKARRSTENYAIFCMKAHEAAGLRSRRDGVPFYEDAA